LALEQTARFATLQRVTIASPDCMPDVRDKLEREGFVFAPASLMRTCLAQTGKLDDWATFADSWNDLALDTYLADFGRYRRRRHAVFSASNAGPGAACTITRAEHQPHYQSLKYNPLQGDIERWFEPIVTTFRRDRRCRRSCVSAIRYSATSPQRCVNGASKCTSSASRPAPTSPASRHRRASTATGSITFLS
jgi:hypothetical protein